ncbi:SDR family oxidoreductase [Ornithinimicrobium sediminis]|uniref:SDR family oxidoreductase n=1 Tax=Ornithinimicrobium sediminis TaxID=2904603 RepID=UPI001E4472FE|nr:SDR family oxidoreductase [Ornithinimicrobium sediminis]MCE0485267.1 SDR family oxidoreductase [Ornithinimicrobium sediminis]
MTIAVTGATGHVGGRTARLLSAAGVPQVLLVRDPSRAPALAGAEVRRAAYGDSVACRRALEGVDVLLMVSASESATRREQHLAMVRDAASSGVRHLVYLSFLNAAPEATFTLARDHWATEQAVRDSGLSATFLRDSFYADVLPLFVGDDGALRGPAGDGRVSAVARRDVAEVATAVLQDPQAYAGRTLDLTGPEALSLQEVAAVLSQTAGREIRYVEESLEQARASRARWHPEPWQLDAWVSTYLAIAAGEVATVSDDVERVLGRAATPFREVVAGWAGPTTAAR